MRQEKLHVGEFDDLYSTPNRPYQPANKIKEKRLAIIWCVWGDGRNVCGQTNEREQLEDLGVEGRLILKWILNT